MNEWHMALTELLVASRDNDVEALKKALNTYRLKSSIGRSVRFHLRYLSKYKRARELANAAANTIIYDKRKPRLPIDANFAMLEEWLNVFGHQLGSMAPRPFYDMNDARSKEDMLRDMQGFSRLVGPYYSWFEQHLNSFLIEAGDLVAALK